MLSTILISLCITLIVNITMFIGYKWWIQYHLMQQYSRQFDETYYRRWEPSPKEEKKPEKVMPFDNRLIFSSLLEQEIFIRARQYRDPDLDEDTDPQQRAIYIEQLKRSTQTLH